MAAKRRRYHVGFWVDVDGTPMHVRDDPNMDERTMEALKAVARAIRNATPELLEEAARKSREERGNG
jgi:hypothetical protein